MLLGQSLINASNVSIILSIAQLLFILQHIAFMHLPHFLDFIQVYDETAFVCMILFDTFSTKDSKMIRTIEMLNALLMPLAEQAFYTILIFKVQISQSKVSFNNFI